MFWIVKTNMKDKCYGFNGYEQKNNVCLVYLEAKLH